jgi:hypothetical protein
MPGFILEHGRVSVTNGTYTVIFDPVALARDFPNLDLIGRDARNLPGLADTFAIGLLMRGRDMSGDPVYRANALTILGQEVFYRQGQPTHRVFLPEVRR